MSLLVDDIKSIASEVLNEARPSKIQVGQYQADGSIVSDINVNPYPPEAVIIPRHIEFGTRRYAMSITGESAEDIDLCGNCPDKEKYPVHPNCSICLGLKAGDEVLFIQDHGGQKLIVLGIL